MLRGMGVWDRSSIRNLGSGLLDLVLPRECGGCTRPGRLWCEDCKAELSDTPIRLAPRVDPGVPVWSLGRYQGPRRRSVIALKERGRTDLVEPLGDAVAGAVASLYRWGELPRDGIGPLILVPAPSRSRAARARGGDPVVKIARAAAHALGPGVAGVRQPLSLSRGVRDSVGLSAAERMTNVAGRVGCDPTVVRTIPRRADVVVLDDVMTTGSTVAESVRALSGVGVHAALALVIAGA
ncbi:putative amidophosphoribosyltransferase [Rhodococcus sp. 27YEA15]|uniref:ComF family protein n=1 Tax=Rhodococcus sp. 27YEA15 TaxID=3156259 RepID=UPI003C7C157A